VNHIYTSHHLEKFTGHMRRSGKFRQRWRSFRRVSSVAATSARRNFLHLAAGAAALPAASRVARAHRLYIRTGRLRALPVTTATRADQLPGIPTVGEFVPGYEASVWYGIGAPRNTPVEVIDELNEPINAGSLISSSKHGLRIWTVQ
jgi:hypothetical protein